MTPSTLLLEYRRDIGRFLRGERDTYPPMPQGYFDEETVRGADDAAGAGAVGPPRGAARRVPDCDGRRQGDEQLAVAAGIGSIATGWGTSPRRKQGHSGGVSGLGSRASERSERATRNGARRRSGARESVSRAVPRRRSPTGSATSSTTLRPRPGSWRRSRASGCAGPVPRASVGIAEHAERRTRRAGGSRRAPAPALPSAVDAHAVTSYIPLARAATTAAQRKAAHQSSTAVDGTHKSAMRATCRANARQKYPASSPFFLSPNSACRVEGEARI